MYSVFYPFSRLLAGSPADRAAVARQTLAISDTYVTARGWPAGGRGAVG